MGSIIWYFIMLLCTFVFFTIGYIARTSTKPMHFYSGTNVDAASITDIKAYNKANSNMWNAYALWYLISTFTHALNPMLAVIMLMFACTIGIGVLVCVYNKILNKYSVK